MDGTYRIIPIHESSQRGWTVSDNDIPGLTVLIEMFDAFFSFPLGEVVSSDPCAGDEFEVELGSGSGADGKAFKTVCKCLMKTIIRKLLKPSLTRLLLLPSFT